MTLAICAFAAARSGPKIIYQVLFYPVATTSTETSTYATYTDGPGLTVPTIHWCYSAYFGDKDEVPNSDPTLSPARKTNIGSAMLSTPEQLKALPPTLLITAAVDPLQAEGEEFAQKLQGAGVPTAFFRAGGQMHDFAMLNGLAVSDTARAAIELAGLKLKKALA
jgi:acetyl esterase